MTVPQAANQRWSLDFVSNVLSDGRRLRVLVVVCGCWWWSTASDNRPQEKTVANCDRLAIHGESA
jgi:hypothetical protein